MTADAEASEFAIEQSAQFVINIILLTVGESSDMQDNCSAVFDSSLLEDVL